MHTSFILLATNPFFTAFTQSDLLGKVIFLSLYALSIITWIILIQKTRMTRQVEAHSTTFDALFSKNKQQPLNIRILEQSQSPSEFPLPFYELYQQLRTRSIELLEKNKKFNTQFNKKHNNNEHTTNSATYLSPTDINFIEAHLASEVTKQTKQLEKNLYLLSTIVSLAPFLGLLGTVWGILTTFSELQGSNTGNTSQMALTGLSLALATTVLGLIDAIPALIGYNFLKNKIFDYQNSMEQFCVDILSSVEFHYRQVDLIPSISVEPTRSATTNPIHPNHSSNPNHPENRANPIKQANTPDATNLTNATTL